jgi:serine/threonine-protein kinase
VVGQTIGSYRIVSQIGEGAMGRVYLAEHRHLKRKAALKLLTRDLVDRPDLVERFFLEARATSAIEHPGIVRIFDCEVDPNGQPYIVMEYLDGETLAAFLARKGPLPPANVARLGQSMAEALEAAHAAGIVHRDLKPENIFVRTQPADSIKLVDFGIAKLAGDLQSGQVHKTRSGILMGTPLYMSPEQCRDSGRIDFRTDIYSLGCVMYEMLTGHPPFVREGLGDLVVAHLTEQPQEVRELIPSVPAPLADLIGQLLRKDPAQRPANMREIARRLAIFVGGLTTMPESVAPAAAVTSPPRRVTARPSVTTFEHSASEVLPTVDELPVTNRRGPLLVGALLTVAAVGAGLFLLKSSVSSDRLADGPAQAATGADAAAAHVAEKPESATELGESNPSAAGKGDSASKRLIASAKKSPTKHASNAPVIGEPTKSPRAVDAIPVGPPRSGPAISPPKETAPPPIATSVSAPVVPGPSPPAPTAAGTITPVPGSTPVAAIVTSPAPPSGEFTGAWEGPWEDVAKQQKGRLFLQIATAGAVTGWMYNRAAKESFRLFGNMTPRGELDLTCKCPPQQGFIVRGSIRHASGGELTGRLSLSTGAVVFGESQLTLRRTTQTR